MYPPRSAPPHSAKSSGADQIGKKVAHIVLGFSGQTADKGHTGCIAAGCRNKHHKDDDQHLRKVAQSAFAGIVLQIGVGHKADDGIEGQSGFHPLDTIGIQKGDALEPENDVTNGHHHRVGSQQSQDVLFPVHPLAGLYSAQLVNQAVCPIEYRVGKGVFSCGDMVKIPPHRNDKDQIYDQCQNQLQHVKFLLYCVLCIKSAPDVPGRIPDIRPAAKQQFRAKSYCSTPTLRYSWESTCRRHQLTSSQTRPKPANRVPAIKQSIIFGAPFADIDHAMPHNFSFAADRYAKHSASVLRS